MNYDLNSLNSQIKSHASSVQHDQCLRTFKAYKTTNNYEVYRDSMFSIFNDNKCKDILFEMVQYTSAEHKVVFAKDIEEFIKNFE